MSDDPFSHPGCRWKFIREATPKVRRAADRRSDSGDYAYGRKRYTCECACGIRREVFREDIRRQLNANGSAGCESQRCRADHLAAQDALRDVIAMVHAGLKLPEEAADFALYARTYARRKAAERAAREMEGIR